MHGLLQGVYSLVLMLIINNNARIVTGRVLFNERRSARRARKLVTHPHPHPHRNTRLIRACTRITLYASSHSRTSTHTNVDTALTHVYAHVYTQEYTHA